MLFHFYAVFLVLSGIAMLVLAGIRIGPSPARRIWSGILGLAFTGYGLYLLLFFKGGHYLIFYYVFILPVLMIVGFFRDRSALRARQQQTPVYQAPPPSFGQPSGDGQPPGSGQAPGDGQPWWGQHQGPQ